MKTYFIAILWLIFTVNTSCGQTILIPSGKFKITTWTFLNWSKALVRVADNPKTVNIADNFFDIHELRFFSLPKQFDYLLKIDTSIKTLTRLDDSTLRIDRNEVFKKGKLVYYEGGFGENWYKCNVFYDSKGRPVKITLNRNQPSRKSIKFKYHNSYFIKEIEIFEQDIVSLRITKV